MSAQIVTGEAFTDNAVKARTDLDQYRVIHFATHGIVTPPQARCPAQPALLTSFGGSGSDGLLTFREIFDLHLDADLVILSACDTASKASTAATREAGAGYRRRRRARRAGARIRRRWGADGARQPLAGARRLQRHREADHGPVLSAERDADCRLRSGYRSRN